MLKDSVGLPVLVHPAQHVRLSLYELHALTVFGDFERLQVKPRFLDPVISGQQQRIAGLRGHELVSGLH